jgi:ERCC4-related helicase
MSESEPTTEVEVFTEITSQAAGLVQYLKARGFATKRRVGKAERAANDQRSQGTKFSVPNF